MKLLYKQSSFTYVHTRIGIKVYMLIKAHKLSRIHRRVSLKMVIYQWSFETELERLEVLCMDEDYDK